MDDRSLLAELKATLAARRREDPLVIAMSQDVKLIRTEIAGQAKCVNLAIGNSRAAVDDVKALREVVMIQADTIIGMQNELIAVNKAVVALTERLDKASEWFKTKGMK